APVAPAATTACHPVVPQACGARPSLGCRPPLPVGRLLARCPATCPATLAAALLPDWLSRYPHGHSPPTPRCPHQTRQGCVERSLSAVLAIPCNCCGSAHDSHPGP